jgi:hypothetical protein
MVKERQVEGKTTVFDDENRPVMEFSAVFKLAGKGMSSTQK